MLTVLGAATALAIIYYARQRRLQRLADAAWHQAADLFDRGAFRQAEQQYAAFAASYPADPRSRLAAAGRQLARLAAAVNAGPERPATLLKALSEFANSAPNQLLADHWPVVLRLAQRAARRRVELAQKSPRQADVEAAQHWLDWLQQQQQTGKPGSDQLQLADLKRSLQTVRQSLAAAGRFRQLLDSAQQCLASGDPARMLQALAELSAVLGSRQPQSPPPPDALTTVAGRLRLALRDRLRFQPLEAAGQPGPGPAVPLLPAESYRLLASRRQVAEVPDGITGTVLVRVKDLCLAVAAATGRLEWLLRVGYDAPQPQMVTMGGEPAVLLAWFRGDQPVVSLCRAADGGTIWSWPVPEMPAGAPAALQERVYVLGQSGAIWELAGSSGRPARRLNLPEPAAGPLAVREDSGGLCVLGTGAVYLFEVGPDRIRCLDAVPCQVRADAVDRLAQWVPPYVLLFENDPVDRCYVRLLVKRTDGYELAEQVRPELKGRLWQAPALVGSRLFLVTDQWKQYCYGLHPSGGPVTLFPAAQVVRQPERPAEPTRPGYAPAEGVPFLSVTDAVRGYRLDQGRALLLEAWNEPLPEDGAVVAGPLQVLAGELLLVPFLCPWRAGLLLQARAARSGQLLWEHQLAASARDLTPVTEADGSTSLLARVPGAGLLLLTGGDRWLARRLATDRIDSAPRVSPQARLVLFTSQGGSRIQAISTQDWSAAKPLSQNPPVRSPLTLIDGDLTIEAAESGSGPERLPGPWLAFVSADNSLELRRVGTQGERVHGVDLPWPGPGRVASATPAVPEPSSTPAAAILPSSIRSAGAGADLQHAGRLPGQWPPVWVAGKYLIVADRHGAVAIAEARRTEGIAHLWVRAYRDDLPPLVTAPLPMGQALLCPAADGRCLLLEPRMLKTVAEYHAASPIRHAAVTQDGLSVLVLEKARALGLRADPAGELTLQWQLQLKPGRWELGGVDRGWALLFNRAGHVLALNAADGRTAWTAQAPAPLAARPVLVGRKLALATVDGGLFFAVCGKPRGTDSQTQE